MTKSTINREQLLKQLSRVNFTTPLTKIVLNALERKAPGVLDLIKKDITEPLEKSIGLCWAHQFAEDIETYGLMEAIGYFHSYSPQPPLWLLEDACQVYYSIAQIYISSNIENSIDPQVRLFLKVGKAKPHAIGAFRGEKIDSPEIIQKPKAPIRKEEYSRQLPLCSLLSSLSFLRKNSIGPKSLEDEILEHIRNDFILRFPGIEQVYHDVFQYLKEHSIDPYCSSGQWIIQQICNDINGEQFGDFNSTVVCGFCDAEFQPEIGLSYANKILKQGVCCCSGCEVTENE